MEKIPQTGHTENVVGCAGVFLGWHMVGNDTARSYQHAIIIISQYVAWKCCSHFYNTKEDENQNGLLHTIFNPYSRKRPPALPKYRDIPVLQDYEHQILSTLPYSVLPPNKWSRNAKQGILLATKAPYTDQDD